MKKVILSIVLGFGMLHLAAQELPIISAAEEFLTAPQTLLEEEIPSDKRTLDMTWCFGENGHFRFITKDNEIYFEVVFLEKFPEGYEEAEKLPFLEQICEIHGQQQKRFIYAYCWNKTTGETHNAPLAESSSKGPNSSSYLVSERRVIEKAAPRVIEETELVSLIREGSVLFYTGAGLSAASEVPTMEQLCSLLGFKMDKESFFSWIKAIPLQPQQLVSNIDQFHRACFFSPPTIAHQALKDLALLKKTQIVTENLDLLHERTGIKPYRVDAQHLQTEIDPSSLKNIDYLICVGLSYDDRGFLGWYKKHHPQGIIIAIDLGTPTYLGNEDYLYQGDLQTAVPNLVSALASTR